MKKNRRKMKPVLLKYKLLLLLIPIVIIYTLVLTAVGSSYIMSSTGNSLKKTLKETAQITAEHISESIDNDVNLTALLAGRVGTMYAAEITAPYDPAAIEKFAQKISQMGVEYGFLHMMVADMDGFTRTALHSDVKTLNADYYMQIAEGKKTSYVSDVSLDKGSFKGKYVLNYSAPIKNADGALIGVLVCKADAAKLSSLVSNISVGDNGSTFIMDSRGQCIAHQDPEMLFSGKTYMEYKDNKKYVTLNKLWDTMETGDEGYMTYDFGGKRIAAFSHIGSTNNWSIAVTVSENEFMRDAQSAQNTASLIGILMLILIGGLLLLVFRFATKGVTDITNRLEALAEGDLSSEVRLDDFSDETFRLSQAASRFTDVLHGLIHDIKNTLGEIANGNLTVKPECEYPGDFGEIKTAIEGNLYKLNDVVQRIARTSEEVARGSTQMASGASGLAQGASEQASSLEELFETVTSLTQRIYEIGGLDKKHLADNDEETAGEDENDAADRKIDCAQTLAEKLIIAIARIEETAGSIRKIASNIEVISSETGMLALNASVEATHAGDAGRGFSVIAGEIRNLSDKSRDAAKDADNKIDSITRAISRGTQTVDVTVSTIGEMSLAMDQVKSALEQISNVVENVAATAEETAAGSEELSAQADMLKNLVSGFKYHSDDK